MHGIVLKPWASLTTGYDSKRRFELSAFGADTTASFGASGLWWRGPAEL